MSVLLVAGRVSRSSLPVVIVVDVVVVAVVVVALNAVGFGVFRCPRLRASNKWPVVERRWASNGHWRPVVSTPPVRVVGAPSGWWQWQWQSVGVIGAGWRRLDKKKAEVGR